MIDRLRCLLDSPWALTPGAHRALVLSVLAQLRGGAGRVEAAAESPAAASQGGVAIVPVRGVLEARLSAMDELWFGGVSAEGVRARVAAAVADTSVRAIVLDVDSPGGDVRGMQETAAAIREARAIKPVVAIANTLMASAAYWIASAATKIVAMPSAEVGSIGVYTVHEDWSKYLEEAGISVSLISAGDGKTAGNMYEPLSDEARADLERRVSAYYAAFVADVAEGRGVDAKAVRGEWKAKLYGASEAKKTGLVDQVGDMAAALTLAARLKPRASLVEADMRAQRWKHYVLDRP